MRELTTKMRTGRERMANPEDFAIFYEYDMIEREWIRKTKQKL